MADKRTQQSPDRKSREVRLKKQVSMMSSDKDVPSELVNLVRNRRSGSRASEDQELNQQQTFGYSQLREESSRTYRDEEDKKDQSSLERTMQVRDNNKTSIGVVPELVPSNNMDNKRGQEVELFNRTQTQDNNKLVQPMSELPPIMSPRGRCTEKTQNNIKKFDLFSSSELQIGSDDQERVGIQKDMQKLQTFDAAIKISKQSKNQNVEKQQKKEKKRKMSKFDAKQDEKFLRKNTTNMSEQISSQMNSSQAFKQIREKSKRDRKAERQQKESDRVKGQKFIQSTIDQQAQAYQKKFPFELGQYHQCIPNPKNSNQRITVQLVKRVITLNQQADKDVCLSQQYERYHLVSPDADQSSEESEYDSEESSDKSSTQNDKRTDVNRMMLKKQTTSFLMKKEQIIDQKLYQKKNLFTEVNELHGIQHKRYADIKRERLGQVGATAQWEKNVTEFAVVAFWDLHETDVFNCTHFFKIPNPRKRIVRDVDGTILYQVLFTSQHTDDVFFFWKGREVHIENDQENSPYYIQSEDQKLQMAFLKLNFTDDEQLKLNKEIISSVESVFTIENDSVLEMYLNDMHEKSLKKQEQLANPTIINFFSKKLLIFSAYLLEESVSYKHTDGNENKVLPSWYPTIYFYDIAQKRVTWEIFGAEQFIDIASSKVTILANEIWNKINAEQYEMKHQDQGYSKHNEFQTYIKMMKFGSKTSQEDLERKFEQAPDQPSIKSYRLNFNSNRNLEITQEFKVPSAYLHNNWKRMTMVYSGLGALTFELKQATSLTQENLWVFSYNDHTFNCTLRFSQKGDKIFGRGNDENENEVAIDGFLTPRKKTNWSGYFETNELVEEIQINQVEFKNQTIQGVCQSEDGDKYELNGTINKKTRTLKGFQNVDFTLTNQNGQVRSFNGKIDYLKTKIEGLCSDIGSKEKKFNFQFQLDELVPGRLVFNIDNQSVEKDIKVDYKTKKILNATGVDELEVAAIEAYDQAEIIFSILHQDATYVKFRGRSYVQAKIIALDQEDHDLEGVGCVAETSAILYDIDSECLRDEEQRRQRIKLAKEPSELIKVLFYLNNSFVKTWEKRDKSDIALWHIDNSFVQEKNGKFRLFGSVLYEKQGTHEIKLNMFSAAINIDKKQNMMEILDYPQEPVKQSWIIDYPLLAYKSYSPKNNQIVIVHLAQNVPQKVINLGEWEFVCFVNHTQMVEQKCFHKNKETNCDLMLLVKMNDRCRLMSFKSNPWLQHNEYEDENMADSDIVKHSFYIFSGDIGVIPTESILGMPISQDRKSHIEHKKRFNNDKVQKCHLITKTLGSYDEYMLIIQFNDCIVQASLNDNFFKLICQSDTMLTLHMLLGYNEKVYFAETCGSYDKISQVEFHPSKSNQIKKKEVYQLPGGRLVAFEQNQENIENDMEPDVNQSFFVIDDEEKIYLLNSNESGNLIVKKTVSFKPHEKLDKIVALRETDWSHVHITERALTMGNTTYNLNTELAINLKIPNHYFGQKKKNSDDDFSKSFNETNERLQDTIEKLKKNQEENEEDWEISSVQGVQMTTKMIYQGSYQQNEFCFVIKPAPGIRKLSIVSFQQLHEVEQMLFVSNQHVLLKFRGGKAVTLLSNGDIIHQEKHNYCYLEDAKRIIGESQVFNGKKTILLEQKYGDKDEKSRHITMQFSERGKAILFGVFNDFKQQIQIMFNKCQENQTSMVVREGKSMVRSRHEYFQRDTIDETIMKADNTVLQKIGSMGITWRGKKQVKNVIRYTKEFFVTEKGEVIKFAAIITMNEEVRQELHAQENYLAEIDKSQVDVRSVFISIHKIENSNRQFDVNAEKGSFTLIVFHLLDREMQERFVRQTQYCVVSNYLCFRRRNKTKIWITKLKEKVDDLIQTSSEFEDQLQTFGTLRIREYSTQCLQINQMANQDQFDQIQMTQIPQSYYSTIKNNTFGNRMEFYDNLLQVTIGTNGMIFDLDSCPVKEVDSIENIDQLINPDNFVNTGFIMSMSHKAVNDETNFIKRVQLFTNEQCNLLFEKKQNRYKDNTKDLQIKSILYRTFSEIDLYELKQIRDAIQERQPFSKIDPESIVCNYEGHSIFSIFFDRIDVYEQILRQLQDNDEFSQEEDINGNDVECKYLKKLYRTLNLPTGDLGLQNMSRELLQTTHMKDFTFDLQQGCLSKLFGCKVKEKRVNLAHGDDAFNTVLKKSLRVVNSRFREVLIQMAMICSENSINNFIENLDDMEILLNSKSQSVYDLFNNAQKQNRFTDSIKMCEWKLGESINVLGRQTSVINERVLQELISDAQNHEKEDQLNVQHRQVQARMFQIDWIFAECAHKQKMGYADFIVALSKTSQEQLFSTELIQTLIEDFWLRFYVQVLLKFFLPFTIYWVTTILYVSHFAVHGIDEDKRWELNSEVFLRLCVIVLTVFFFAFEVKSMLRDGFCQYISSVYNYLDNLSFVMNIAVIIKVLNSNKDNPDDLKSLRTQAAFAVFLTWVKAFYLMRLFEPTSFFVRLIFETFKDIFYGLLVFIVILMMFGNALIVLSQDREPFYFRYFEEDDSDYLNVFLNMYELSIGTWAYDGIFSENKDDSVMKVTWLIFVLSTMITQIIFLNMLIAIMGDTYDRVSESKDQTALVEKIRFLSDSVYVVKSESVARGTQNRFLFAVKTKQSSNDEFNNWQGRLTMIKRSIVENVKNAQENIEKSISKVNSEIINGANKMNFLEDRITDIQSQISKMQATINTNNRKQMAAIFKVMDHMGVERTISHAPSARSLHHDQRSQDIILEKQSNNSRRSSYMVPVTKTEDLLSLDKLGK